MKKTTIFPLIVIALLLVSCTTEVTVTVTSTPSPTETPIPTPTFHPQFIVLLEKIAASGGRFTLQPDGTIQDGTETIPGIAIKPDGTMTLTVKGEAIALGPDSVNFGEDGIKLVGYELNDNDDWVASVFKIDLEEIMKMSPAEVLTEAPEIDGYKPLRAAERYVIYENGEGARDLAYDMSTGEEVEIPQYKICSNEKFFDCVIPQEDLINGKYWLWLNTLDVKFDPSKIKDVPFVIDTNDYASSWVDRTTVYNDSGPDLPADFSDPATAPFARNVTSGVVNYNEGGVSTFAAVRPVFFYDKDSGHIYPIVAIQSYFYNQPGRDDDPRNNRDKKNLNNWINNYKVTPLAVGCYTYAGDRMCKFSLVSGTTDPILEASELLYPDMEARLREFAEGNYVSLSRPGLIVQTTSDVYPSNNQYK